MPLTNPAFDRSAIEGWFDDINSGCMFVAASIRGVPAERVIFSPRPAARPPQQWLQLSIGRRRYMYRKAVMYFSGEPFTGPFTGPVQHINRSAPAITSSKYKTSVRLREAGIPVPSGRVFDRDAIGAALRYFRSVGREVCIKPSRGMSGVDVVPRIGDAATFRGVFARVAERHQRIVVEESVSGDVIRYMVVGGRIAAVRLDRPASVVGDGTSTIADLVAARNADIRSSNLPIWKELLIDDEAERMLALDGLSLSSHLPAGKRAFLRATSNIPTGADGVGNPPGLHPSYAGSALEAVAAVPDLALASVDVMVSDYRQPATAANHWFLDLNSAPGVANFHFPREGEPSDVA